jgi:hypothetical protein
MPLNLSSGGLTKAEFEKLVLALSVFQDGTGWERSASNQTEMTYAGYRQFERSVAEICNGKAQENKGIFDVIAPLPKSKDTFGISCKMRKELRKAQSANGRITIELTNASRRLNDVVNQAVATGIQDHPGTAGAALLQEISKWHFESALAYEAPVNLNKSCQLVLLYDEKKLTHQLFVLPLRLPPAETYRWAFPPAQKIGVSSNRLVAYEMSSAGNGVEQVVLAWYFKSGGQIKYYPHVTSALWASEEFKLHPLPNGVVRTISERARQYFPKQWAQAESQQ